MITSQTIITQIIDENIIGAKQSIQAFLLQKAKVFLDDKRRCLASVSYGPCTESSTCDCGCDEPDEDCECDDVDETLTDKQKKLDKNHNDVLDGQDFKIVRGKKKKEKD